jgi:hypothetical protein
MTAPAAADAAGEWNGEPGLSVPPTSNSRATAQRGGFQLPELAKNTMSPLRRAFRHDPAAVLATFGLISDDLALAAHASRARLATYLDEED